MYKNNINNVLLHRFYRCVKFNQAIEDYSVFEFDCPAGLSFDENTEVCVWPGSLSKGSPCPGSSEIAPVAPKRFECSQPGYYADPQNCRWFFACMDLGVLQFMRNKLFMHSYIDLMYYSKSLKKALQLQNIPHYRILIIETSIQYSLFKFIICAQNKFLYKFYVNFIILILTGGSELMAFEFRCPYGLVFDEKKLVCEWPWLVPACSESGSSYTRTEYNYGDYTAGTSAGVGVDGYVTSGLPKFSVTAGTDYSNVDYSRRTSTSFHGPNYFGSTGDIDKRPGISISGAGHVGLSSPVGTDYSKSTEYEGISVPTYSGSPDIQIASVSPNTIVVGESNTGYSTSSSKIDNTGYTVSSGQDGTGYSVSTSRFNTGFANTGGVTAGFSGSTAREYSGTVSGNHLTEQGVTYSGTPISSYPSSGGYIGSVSTSSPIIDYSSTPESYFGSTKLPASSIVHVESTSPKYVGSTNVYAGSSALDTNDYSASTGVYSGTTGRQPIFGETGPSFGSVSYSGAIDNVARTEGTNRDYSESTATAYRGSTDTGYSKTTGGISTGPSFGSVSYSGAIGNVDRTSGTNKDYSESTTTTYGGSTGTGYSKTTDGISTNPSFGSVSYFGAIGNVDRTGGTNKDYSESTATSYGGSTGTGYSKTTGGISTGPSFVSYSGAIGNVDRTGGTNKDYSESTATYGGSTGTGYSKTTGGISTGFIKNNINLSTNSGMESSLHSTSSDRVQGTDFISGVPKFGLESSGISTISGHVSVKPTGFSSTNYRYNNEEEYTIPVFIHEEPLSYPSIGTTGAEVRGHAGTTGTSKIALTSGYGKTDFVRPNLNISIFGNEIPTGYDVQKSTIGAIQTEGSVDGSIITSDSFSGTVFNHGNVLGAVSTPAIDQGTVLTGGVRPGYVATSSGTSGYVISDGVKTLDVGSTSPGTLIYGTPSPAISINGPSTASVLLKDDSTPSVVISGQTAPGVSIGGSIRPGSTIESSTHKSYESQSIYHGISDASTRGSITYSSSTPKEGLSTLPQGYRTNEGYGTVMFNAAYDTNKYTENDIPDYRPTSAILPDSIVSGGRVEGTGSDIFGSTFESSTTPRYFSSKSAVFTPSGFTKTGPTRTGITTAILGGGGSYSISTGDRRSNYNPDNISEKAFEGNVAGYTKTSFTDGLSITLTPPSYSSTAAPGGRVTVQSVTSGYSYPKPTVQFGTSGATFSSTPIAPIENNLPVTTSTPFFSRLPSSTVRPIIYTTEHPEVYKTTPFESNKIPVSIVRPEIDTDYKTVISSTTIPVLSDNRFTQRTGGSQTASVSTSNIGLGVPFQRTDLSGQTGYSSSLGYLPAKSTEPGVITSPKYDVPMITARPEFGITYKKPSSVSDVTYGGPSSFQSPTTFRPSNVYYSPQGFSTTPSSLGTTCSGSSPTNLDISRDKIDKLITNYDRGTIKYTPPVYDTYTSSGFDSTSTKKFTSSLSSTKSFSAKAGSFAVTTPFGIRPSTFSYEVTTKSPESKGKVIVKWSDLHPLLLGKLGAECTCKADPFANLRGPGKKLIDSSKGKVDLANYDSSEIYVDLGSSEEDDYSTNYNNFPAQPFKISPHETTTFPTSLPSSSYLPGADARTSARSNEFRSGRRMGKKLEYKEEEEEEEEKEEYDDDPDQIINGVTDCARPGLFRHPGLCNKFYACHWDQWKKKFTLHIFNCPIHLTFDTNAGACNWPSKGPACQADNLLV